MSRWFKFLFVCVLGALVATVVYAVTGMRGADDVLREARLAVQERDYVTALHLLDVASRDHSMAGSEGQTEILSLRAAVHEATGATARALEDLRQLDEAYDIDTQDVTRRRIILHQSLDTPEDLLAAWRIANNWLEDNPDDPIILALAGRTKDFEARALLTEWMRDLETSVPADHRGRLQELSRRAVFAPASSAHLAAMLKNVSDALREFVPGTLDANARLTLIHDLFYSAKVMYLRSLATDAPAGSAYQGVSAHLRAADEHDTLLMIAHKFMRRAGPISKLEAAIDIAQIHLQHGRFRAAEEIVERTIPTSELTASYRPQRRTLELLLCRAAASFLGERTQLERTTLHKAISRIPRYNSPQPQDRQFDTQTLHLINGLLLPTRVQQTNNLQIFAAAALRWKPRMVGRDYFIDLAFERYLKLEAEAPSARRVQISGIWVNANLASLEARHAAARSLIDADEGARASSMLMEILPLHSDTVTMNLLVEAQLNAFPGDLDEVILRAGRQAVSVPDEIEPFPALTLAVARRALRIGHPQITVACAERARTLFPGSALPVEWKARGLLALNRPQEADRAIKTWLEQHPETIELLALSSERTSTGSSPTQLFNRILHGEPTLENVRYLANRWFEQGEYARVERIVTKTRPLGSAIDLEALASKAVLRIPTSTPEQIETILGRLFELADRSTELEDLRHAVWALGQYAARDLGAVPGVTRDNLLTTFLLANESPESLEQVGLELAAIGDLDRARRAFEVLLEDERFQNGRRGRHFVVAGQLAVAQGNLVRARDYFSAALGFPDGADAEPHVALLDAQSGVQPKLPQPHRVDNLLIACLTDQPAKAIAFLKMYLSAHPGDVPASCVLSVIDPKAAVPALVSSLAETEGNRLKLLVALLQDPLYATLAVARAAEVVTASPTNPVAQLLWLNALAHAQQWGEVTSVITGAQTLLMADKTLLTAALRIVTAKGSPLVRDQEFVRQMLGLVNSIPPNIKSDVLARLVGENPTVLDNPQLRSAILPHVANHWRRHPSLSGVGLAQIEILAQVGDFALALEILEKLEFEFPTADRAAYLDLFFSTASRYASNAGPEVIRALRQRAAAVLETEAPHGAPLHFLLDSLHSESRLAPDVRGNPARERLAELEKQFIPLHLDYFRSGGDPNPTNLHRSIARLGARYGAERAIRALDGILRDDPSLLSCWLLRSELLLQLDRVDEAVDSAMWIPQYLDDPETVNSLARLLAFTNLLAANSSLFGSVRSAPAFLTGLLDLRQGAYTNAIPALDSAEAQPDGAHLYYRALALIAHDSANISPAQSLLNTLVSGHPDSPYVASARLVLRTFPGN